ncbi:phage tail tape measure protein [Streptomyces olivaceus]|uniref:phage tail tape measure protein n=1 Tax=Streptomyces olivaceus TaxID=47716 RepID=UPI00363ECD54
MAGDEEDYGSARITIDLDESGAVRQASAVGADIERALVRATRTVGSSIRDNLQRGLSARDVTVAVAPDLSRFDRELRNGLSAMDTVLVPVEPDIDGFRQELERAAATTVVVPVEPDTAGFISDVEQMLRGVNAEIELQTDAHRLVQEIEAELARISPPTIALDVVADLSRVRSQLASLDGPTINAVVTLDVDRVRQELQDLADQGLNIPITIGGGGGAGAAGGAAGLAALGGLRAAFLAAGPWGAIVAGVASYAALIGKTLMAGIEGVISHQQLEGELRAALGLGVTEAREVGRVVGQLYARGVTESVEEGTAAVQAALRNGLAAPEDLPGLEAVATQVSDLGRLMEEDIGKVARAVGTMVKTGLVDNASEGLDLLTKSVQQGGNVAEDLLDTFTEYPTQFRQLGVSAEEAFGLIQQGLRGGARDSDVIADSLKEFSIEAAQGGKRVMDAFKQAGLDAERLTSAFAEGGPAARDALQEVFDKLQSIEDPLERNQVAVGLFGTKAEDMAGALASLDLRTAADELGAFGGAAAKAGDDLRDNLGNKIQTIGRELKQAFEGLFTGDFSQFADVGRAIDDALPDLKETGVKIAQSLEAGLTEYGPKVFAKLFEVAFQFGENVDVWGPIVVKLIAGASVLPAVIGGLLLTAIGGALAGLGSALLPYLEGAWHSVAGFFTDTIPDLASDIGSGIADAFGSAFDSASGVVSDGIDGVIGFFTGLPGMAGEALSSLGTSIGDAFIAAFEAGEQAASDGVNAVAEFFMALPGMIVAALAALPGLLLDAFTSAVAYVAIGLLTLLAGLIFLFFDLPTKIAEALVDLGAYLISAFTSGFTAATEWLGQAIERTGQYFEQLPGRAYNALASLGSRLLAALNSAFVSAGVRIAKWVSDAVNLVKALPGRAGNALTSLGSRLLAALNSAFVSAGVRIAKWVSDAVNLVKALPGRAGNALSSLGSQIGGAISRAAGTAKRAAQNLISGLANAFRDLPSRIAGAIGNVGSQIMSKIKSGLPSAVRDVLPFADGGIVDHPVVGLVGEAGPEVIIPLTRPQRAQELAAKSGLLEILGMGKQTSAAGGQAERTLNQYVTINEVGDAHTTAHRVTTRLALAGGML